MSKIVILGAAGQIARQLTAALLDKTSHELVLFGRQLRRRLTLQEDERITIVEGTFEDEAALSRAIEGADVVYLNAMEDAHHTQTVVHTMAKLGVKRLIGATMAGIENEVPDPLLSWTEAHLPAAYVQGEQASADVVKASEPNYTLLRLTWLYDKAGDTAYELVPSGEPFRDAEVSREAVVAAILEILADETGRFYRSSLGVGGRPDTHYAKPSFY